MKPRVEVDFNSEGRRAFKNKLPKYCPQANEFLINHARSGLLLALQSLNLPQGSRVGVMAYNCHTVMNAVEQAGCEVVFIDVDDDLRIDLNDLEMKIVGLKVLIVTHLFGIINEINTIRAHYPRIVVIEDCAHAFGKEIDGDFGVYSIGQGKLPSLGDGGILLVNNSKYVKTVCSLYEKLQEYSPPEEMKLYWKLYMTDLVHRRLFYSLITRRFKQRKRPQSGREAIVIRKMSRGVRAMFALQKDGVFEQIQLRLENAEKEIRVVNNNPLVKNVLLGTNAFMLVVRSSNVKELKKQYAQRGIETATHFANSLFWAKTFGYRGECPNSEILVKELLMIPVY